MTNALDGVPAAEFLKRTGEACEHLRFFECSDGVFFAIDMVQNVAYRRDEGKPGHLLCDYCPAAVEMHGKGLMGPIGKDSYKR